MYEKVYEVWIVESVVRKYRDLEQRRQKKLYRLLNKDRLMEENYEFTEQWMM